MKKLLTKKTSLNCRGQLLDISKPVVMGILNITPDSFYDGGKYSEKEKVQQRLNQMIDEGATLVDIGAYSSRPGSTHISEKEELGRLIPVLELIVKFFPDLIVSVDTFRSGIASLVVNKYGVSIINDISAGELDHKMFETINKLQVPYIMMHMKGNPKNMQSNTQYKNMIKEIIAYFSKKVNKLKEIGVRDLIIDPGFGFSKTILQNYQLLKNLKQFEIFGFPILAGISRKSMIYNHLGIDAKNALNGTSILNTVALQNGANILRVHDIKEALEVINLVELVQ
ncbi:MAG: dihydropteroate synthase [Bacteroidetes bacterium]|nr:MAG: dihydropteroate synthase [Bacteroidota bacterium]